MVDWALQINYLFICQLQINYLFICQVSHKGERKRKEGLIFTLYFLLLYFFFFARRVRLVGADSGLCCSAICYHYDSVSCLC